MGAQASVTGQDILPESVLGDIPRGFKCASCNDKSALILTDSKSLELRKYDGETHTKALRMKPTACCGVRSNGWAVGFINGYLTEFDAELNVVMSYRMPGQTKAHVGEIKKVFYIDNEVGGLARLMTFGEDKAVRFWGKDGQLLYTFMPQFPIVHMTASPYIAFFADDHKQIHTIKIDTFTPNKFQVISNIKSLCTVGDGVVAMLLMENRHVCLVSHSKVVVSFKFPETDLITEILPLICEDGTGLITYVTADMQGKLMLRALERVTSEFGEGVKVISDSLTHLLADKDGMFAVYRRDDIETMSMQVLPEMDLPRMSIVAALMDRV